MAAVRAIEYGIHKVREQDARDPEAAFGYEGQRAGKLLAGFGVSEQALHAHAEERVAIGFVELFADDDEAGRRIGFENIGDQGGGGLLRGVRVDHVDAGFGDNGAAKLGSEAGFKLLGDYAEARTGEQLFEFTKD